jgi:hypothetical protein
VDCYERQPEDGIHNRQADRRYRELSDSRTEPMAPKIPAQQVIAPPAFTDRGRFCWRVFLLPKKKRPQRRGRTEADLI